MLSPEIDKVTKQIVSKLRAQYDPEKVILFGSYARGNPIVTLIYLSLKILIFDSLIAGWLFKKSFRIHLENLLLKRLY